MTLSPLLGASFPIAFHAFAALAALLLGAWQLFMKKGTRAHKIVGYVWVGLLAFVAITGLFIHKIQLIGPFSPIHLLSLFALIQLWRGVRAARAGDIERHKRTMRALYFFALVVAGAFTLLPGRVLYQVLVGA